MKSQHTPGPWHLGHNKYDAIIYNGVTIATICDDATHWKSNARLIASAPELLVALERIESELGHEPEMYSDILSIARAAIAKANGGAR
jgi:hypothetical protein